MTGDGRRPDYRIARIAAAGALTLVVVVIVIVDVVPAADYDASPLVLVPLLGTILTLLGIEARSLIGGDGP